MKLLIAGGTGFIGTPLCQALIAHGHELSVLTRQPQGHLARAHLHYLPWQFEDVRRAIAEVEGVINLAGESIAAKRWSPRQKLALQESRFHTTRLLVDAMASQGTRPVVLINASAIGYYGARGSEPLLETSPPGDGFLAELCKAWEREAQRAEPRGVRVVRIRIGMVLGPDGGALSKMVPPFRWCMGGPVGSGRQWVSWIHRADVVGLIEWALTHPEVSGAVNATAPDPVTMDSFCRELGRAVRRPSWARVPGGVLRILLGEMAELLLTGQRVIPNVALRSGYAFQFPELHHALATCVTSSA